MNYETFTKNLCEHLETLEEPRITTMTEAVLKNNGRKQNSLLLFAGETTVAHVISLDTLYQKHLAGASMEELAKEALLAGRQNADCEAAAEQLGKLAWNWESARELVRPILLSRKWNEELAARFVHTDFLDLMVCYHLHILEGGLDSLTLRVPHGLLKDWGITKEELSAQAFKNLELDGYHVVSMASLLDELLEGGMPASMQRGDRSEMSVLTNHKNLYGAAGILNKTLLAERACRSGHNLFLLPSSIHEFILVADDGKEDYQLMNQMVREVNESSVLEEERLSDHIYYYDMEKDEIRSLE